MGLIHRSKLVEENEFLERALKDKTNQLIEEMRKVIALESILMKYQSLGSFEYLKRLVEADKKKK